MVTEETRVLELTVHCLMVQGVPVETRDLSVQDQRVQEVLRVFRARWDRRVLEVHKDSEVIRVLSHPTHRVRKVRSVLRVQRVRKDFRDQLEVCWRLTAQGDTRARLDM